MKMVWKMKMKCIKQAIVGTLIFIGGYKVS